MCVCKLYLSRSQWTRTSRNWGWWSGSEPPVPALCPDWPPHTPEDIPAQGPPASQTHAADWATGNQSAVRKREISNLLNIICHLFSLFSLDLFQLSIVSNLYKHESLHGFVPLQQNNPRLQSSAEILVTRVRIPHWQRGKESRRSNSIRVCVCVWVCTRVHV